MNRIWFRAVDLKRVGLAAALCGLLLALSCAKRQNSVLALSVIPSKPVIIPYGDGATVGGKDVTAPYFSVDRMSITYTGAAGTTFRLLAIQIASTKTDLNCSLGGDDLALMFSSDGVVIPNATTGATTITSSLALGCSSVKVDPKGGPYNIPATVTALGVVLDSAGSTVDRGSGKASIVLY